MNKRQKLVQQQFLNNEEAVIKRLNRVYNQSLTDINSKIKNLSFTIGELQQEYDWLDDLDPEKAKIKSKIQSKIYQKSYQEQLQKQVSGILNQMQASQYVTVSDYLDGCYNDGFIGTIFDAHGQGVPIIMPINQEAMVRAVQLDSKISKGLYTRLGEDVALLKKKITAQVSRGIATGMNFSDVAKQLENYSRIGYNNAIRIARTEGHRIQTTATMDAMTEAKDRGADVVKQWDSTLDGATRESHVAVDGQIRELNEKFSNGLMYPGDPSGGAAEVINCRCALLQRARWAVEDDDKSFTKFNNFTQKVETFQSPEDYDEFKKAFFSKENKAYMNYVEQMQEKYGTNDFKRVLAGMNDREYQHYSKMLATNPIYNTNNLQKVNKLNSQKVYNIGGVNCTVTNVASYDFTDGTSKGVKKSVPATIYTTPDGTKFVYPKGYNKNYQTLTPEQAIETWQRVPENIRNKIQKTVEVVDYYNPKDAHWKQLYKNFTQSYATGGEKITIYRWANHDLDYLVHTFCHEGGHFIDYHLPNTNINNRYCMQVDWQQAMAKDLQTSGKKSWRAYGENSPLEDFADSVGYYTLDHANFVKTFPERARLLAKILK